MNTTYLLITLAICLITAFGWYMVHRHGQYSDWAIFAFVTSIVSGIMLMLSLFGCGITKVVFSPPARIESTPYRVIVVAFGQESVFTDAYTVANVDRIAQVRQTTQRNAWGWEIQSSYAVVFNP